MVSPKEYAELYCNSMQSLPKYVRIWSSHHIIDRKTETDIKINVGQQKVIQKANTMGRNGRDNFRATSENL